MPDAEMRSNMGRNTIRSILFGAAVLAVVAEDSCLSNVKIPPIISNESPRFKPVTVTCKCCNMLQYWAVTNETTADENSREWSLKTGIVILRRDSEDNCHNTERKLIRNATCLENHISFTSPPTYIIMSQSYTDNSPGEVNLQMADILPALIQLPSGELRDERRNSVIVGTIDFETFHGITEADLECRANMEVVEMKFLNRTRLNPDWFSREIFQTKIRGLTAEERICINNPRLCSQGSILLLETAQILLDIPSSVYDHEDGHLRQLSCRFLNTTALSNFWEETHWKLSRQLKYYIAAKTDTPPTIDQAEGIDKTSLKKSITSIPVHEYIVIAIVAISLAVMIVCIGVLQTKCRKRNAEKHSYQYEGGNVKENVSIQTLGATTDVDVENPVTSERTRRATEQKDQLKDTVDWISLQPGSSDTSGGSAPSSPSYTSAKRCLPATLFKGPISRTNSDVRTSLKPMKPPHEDVTGIQRELQYFGLRRNTPTFLSLREDAEDLEEKLHQFRERTLSSPQKVSR